MKQAVVPAKSVLFKRLTFVAKIITCCRIQMELYFTIHSHHIQTFTLQSFVAGFTCFYLLYNHRFHSNSIWRIFEVSNFDRNQCQISENIKFLKTELRKYQFEWSTHQKIVLLKCNLNNVEFKRKTNIWNNKNCNFGYKKN